jgi:hypothetical protein
MRLHIGAALTILFPGVEKEEESHDGQIGNGSLMVSGARELSDGSVQVDEQLERDGPYPGQRRVLFIVGLELLGGAKVGVSKAVVPGVQPPHAGKDLGHGANLLLHGPPLANGPTIGSKVASANTAGKHLEERDGVLHPSEGWVEPQFGAEGAPLSPICSASGHSA